MACVYIIWFLGLIGSDRYGSVQFKCSTTQMGEYIILYLKNSRHDKSQIFYNNIQNRACHW